MDLFSDFHSLHSYLQKKNTASQNTAFLIHFLQWVDLETNPLLKRVDSEANRQHFNQNLLKNRTEGENAPRFHSIALERFQKLKYCKTCLRHKEDILSSATV